MDARHTPGPFEARDDHSAIGVGDMTLARVYWGEGRTPEEDIANARLFAAAPELLERLEVVFALVERHKASLIGEHGITADEYEAAFKPARDAIAKAKGE